MTDRTGAKILCTFYASALDFKSFYSPGIRDLLWCLFFLGEFYFNELTYTSLNKCSRPSNKNLTKDKIKYITEITNPIPLYWSFYRLMNMMLLLNDWNRWRIQFEPDLKSLQRVLLVVLLEPRKPLIRWKIYKWIYFLENNCIKSGKTSYADEKKERENFAKSWSLIFIFNRLNLKWLPYW